MDARHEQQTKHMSVVHGLRPSPADHRRQRDKRADDGESDLLIDYPETPPPLTDSLARALLALISNTQAQDAPETDAEPLSSKAS